MARIQSIQTKVEIQTNSTAKQNFLFKVRDCPKSLKLIVKFYRIFGLSFSGITFDDKRDVNSAKKDNNSAIPLSGIIMILFNIAMVLFKFSITLKIKVDKLKTPEMIPIENQTLKHYFSLQHYAAEFADLKPILRMIMMSVLYVYIGETAILYFVNIFNGGKLVRQLTTIPGIQSANFDTDQSLAKRFIMCVVVIITVVYMVAILMFNREQIVEFFAWLFRYQPTFDKNKKLLLIQLIITTFMHFLSDVVVSAVPVLFLYSMIIFRQHVLVIRNSVKKVDLDEIHLVKIKNNLTTINKHFLAILRNFSVVITCSLISITFLIVSSSCYLMINRGKSKQQMGFIFIYGLTSFIRLIIICSSGNLVTNAYRDLIRVIYESVPEWDLDSWMCFNEIRRLKGKFKVIIFCTYSVKQSAILAVLAFALNYIVVLLQTENYTEQSVKGNSSQVNA